ncbi:MAG TPA: hypothetical protein VEF04_11995 [Blastocatellia bacterium]|nr:hypothetical protein [Blastocatellia bacterium]
MNEVAYRFEDRILIVEYPDSYTVQNMRQVFATAFSHPDFVPGVKVLIDASQAEVFPSADEMMERVRLLISLRYEVGQECAVVVNNPNHYRIVQTISSQISKQGFYLRGFYDFNEAMNWLKSLSLSEPGMPCSPQLHSLNQANQIC